MSQAIWTNMKSKLQAMGLNVNVMIGEPTSPPEPITVAIIPMGGSVPETVLDAPRETHVVTLRCYANALAEPKDETEFKLDAIRTEVQNDFCGDFDLGGTIAYPLPTEFQWDYGYQSIGGSMFRMLDITFGYRVDPAARYVA